MQLKISSSGKAWRFLPGAWCLLAVIASAQSTPFTGQPHPVPGRIQAEQYDLGGEGVAYHRSSEVQYHPFHLYELSLPQGRLGVEIPIAGPGFSQVVLQEGEWICFTVQCAETGDYSVQLLTGGPPSYVLGHHPPASHGVTMPGRVVFHLELDGHNVTGPLEGRIHSLTAPLRISAGRHQIRLVVDHVSNTVVMGDNGHMVWDWHWTFFTFSVDWLQVTPAASPLRAVTVAGGTAGFQDGQGNTARLGVAPRLVGEEASGTLVILDPANAAVRRLSADGRVDTIAGAPGNPVRDGTGSEAGFATLLGAAVSPGTPLLVLETDGSTRDGVREVTDGGQVTTLYSGRPVVPYLDPLLPKPQPVTNITVPLRQVTRTDTGDIEARGPFSPLYQADAINGEVIYRTRDWHARFQIADGAATLLEIVRSPLPGPDPNRLGEAFRFDGTGDGAGPLVQEVESGFPEEPLAGVTLSSVLRAANGSLMGTLPSSQVVRLEPFPDSHWLRTPVVGRGVVEGNAIPYTHRSDGEEVRLEARPLDASSHFVKWSDGDTTNPRTVRLTQVTWLTAHFGWSATVPGSQRLTTDGRLAFQVTVEPRPCRYRLQTSGDLVTWRPLNPETVSVGRSGVLVGDLLDCWEEPVEIQCITGAHQQFIRLLPDEE